MIKPVSYRELAREAKSRGDHEGVMRAFIQHRRVWRKTWPKKKAAASTVAR
jgi:hypothetical protein